LQSAKPKCERISVARRGSSNTPAIKRRTAVDVQNHDFPKGRTETGSLCTRAVGDIQTPESIDTASISQNPTTGTA